MSSGIITVFGYPVTLSLKINGGTFITNYYATGSFKIQGPNVATLATQPDVQATWTPTNGGVGNSFPILDFSIDAAPNVTEEVIITINAPGDYYFY